MVDLVAAASRHHHRQGIAIDGGPYSYRLLQPTTSRTYIPRDAHILTGYEPLMLGESDTKEGGHWQPPHPVTTTSKVLPSIMSPAYRSTSTYD